MIAALVRGYFARQAWQRRQLAKQRIAGLLRSWLLVRRLSAQRLRRAASARLSEQAAALQRASDATRSAVVPEAQDTAEPVAGASGDDAETHPTIAEDLATLREELARENRLRLIAEDEKQKAQEEVQSLRRQLAAKDAALQERSKELRALRAMAAPAGAEAPGANAEGSTVQLDFRRELGMRLAGGLPARAKVGAGGCASGRTDFRQELNMKLAGFQSRAGLSGLHRPGWEARWSDTRQKPCWFNKLTLQVTVSYAVCSHLISSV
jgi:hypothetical protein